MTDVLKITLEDSLPHRHRLPLTSAVQVQSTSARTVTSRALPHGSANQPAANMASPPSPPEEASGLPEANVLAPADEEAQKAADSEVDLLIRKMRKPILLGIDFTKTARIVRAPSELLNVGFNNSLHQLDDSSPTNLIQGQCCGGGCCRLPSGAPSPARSPSLSTFDVPNNAAFRSLNLKLSPLSSRSRLSSITPLPVKTISFEKVEPSLAESHKSTAYTHPPKFVTPHPPYEVFAAKIDSSRELTRPDAIKRTYHFDLDVTDYPKEAEGVDFRVGGAIGVQAPNDHATIDALFDLLGISAKERDEPVLLKTQGGRWPTIWGEEDARSLLTTRRELLTWTVDVQSYPPTKNLLRLLAEYAEDEDQKTILLYLCSKQGQAAFCELRTGPYVTLEQLLTAFPSSRPPLDHLLCNLSQLMPRFYSLSNDPHFSRHQHKRTIEIAVTVHDSEHRWRPGRRTGVGSGFFERMAQRYIKGENTEPITIPMFRGLMANPLAKEFVADGPMLLIGAGVGIAPFRGFVQRRLQNANCVNKVWVLQGVRDSLVDELYSGEWGVHDEQIKKVVESRVGTGRYVQDEVRNQADLVWNVINAMDGRVFVCGSSKGMGEGVEAALVDVAMGKGRLSREEATNFWTKKKEGGQYIAETW